MTISAPLTASTFGTSRRGADAGSCLSRLFGAFELHGTEWPARTLDVASALPTLPEPMMAIFIPISFLAASRANQGRKQLPVPDYSSRSSVSLDWTAAKLPTGLLS